MIPNGSGNDFAAAFKLSDIQTALDYILAGELVDFDVCKVIVDEGED